METIGNNQEQSPEILSDLRERIDKVDNELVDLLGRRFALTQDIGFIKARRGLPPVDPTREQEKLQDLWDKEVRNNLPIGLTQDLWRIIMAAVVIQHEEERRQNARFGHLY